MNPKKSILLILFFLFFHPMNSQIKSKFFKNLSIEYGLNCVDSSGNQDPLTIFKVYSDIAFTLPFKFEIDYLLNNTFELYLSGSSNKFLSNQFIDSRESGQSYTYFAIDLGLKHAIVDVDILSTSVVGFAKVGIGMFKVKSLSPSANIGMGGVIRLNENTDFIISSEAKFAIDHKYLDSNHFQHFIGLKYRFRIEGDNCFCPY